MVSILIQSPAMESLTNEERDALILAIATREGTARQIASWYGATVEELKTFVDANKTELETARELHGGYTWPKIATQDPEPESIDVVTPEQLDDLWISSKFDRLTHYQSVADDLYHRLKKGNSDGAVFATELREFRSYLLAAANELGQLLHRGAGEGAGGDTLGVEISGVDMDTMR